MVIFGIKTHREKWWAYCRLMRLNRPIGSLLLLWPTLWALWLSGLGRPDLYILIVFILGVVLMRSAGCVINDFADRHVDEFVTRTAGRPFPRKEVTEKETKILFAVLIILAFLLVLTLNSLTIFLSVAALALAWIYPFMKRVTHLPQLVLGVAFSWSIPMAYAAITNQLSLACWLLLLANVCWTVGYDTIYAMVDRPDDIKVGIRSTAILFGRFDRMIVGLFQLLTILLLIGIGMLNALSNVYYVALCGVVALFLYQQWLIAERDRARCFKAFMNNNWVGGMIFFGIWAGLL